ncbi:MAG: VOC family protein [Planctomycetota bacterium]
MKKNAPPVPGTFCWIELGTTDPAGAMRFYGQLFGWTGAPSPAGAGESCAAGGIAYTIFRLRDREIAGLYNLQKEQLAQGVPPHWLAYVAVADADAATARAKELGGTVVLGPLDVMDLGRMSLLQDPTGAWFALWQARRHRGMELAGELGTTCWFELMTRDVDVAGDFYAALFGWDRKTQDMGPLVYTIFELGGQPAGGMMAITPEMGELPSHWMIYVSVADCDADAQRVPGLGGRICFPPTDVPGVGRFAVLADPAGAAIAIIRLAAACGQ